MSLIVRTEEVIQRNSTFHNISDCTVRVLGTAIVNEVTESKFEEEAEESASVGAGGVQNKAPFSDLITSPVSTDAGNEM